MGTVSRSKQHRVAEIFGPTIQGEGRNVGMPCHFVRYGGCDFRCSWCDTPHAVLEEQVMRLPKMTEWDIIHSLNNLDMQDGGMSPKWIVLTGGNPALRDLSYLIELLHVRHQKVMLETQGTVYREWFGSVDDLCFSPKPPSSGMEWDFDLFQRILDKFYVDHAEVIHENPPYLKVPVFTYGDLDFAKAVHRRWPDIEMFLSIGNDNPAMPTVGNPNPDLQSFDNPREAAAVVLQNFRDWTDIILRDQELADVRTFPQQHTLIWGNGRGH